MAPLMTPALYRVERVHRETRDVVTLELTPVAADKRISFLPGQFAMLSQSGVREAPVFISGSPSYHALVHTICVVDSVTEGMAKLKPGNVLGVRGPFGSHWPLELAKGKDLVVIAGGLGLAPVRPILYHVLENRNDFGRFCLLYGAASSEDILYRFELERWRSHLDLEVDVTVDHAALDWRGNVGVATNLIPRAPFDPEKAVAMVCGPEIMMGFSVQVLEALGMPKEAVYLFLERAMRCATGHCGHRRFDLHFVCKEGPVFRFDQIESLFDSCSTHFLKPTVERP